MLLKDSDMKQKAGPVHIDYKLKNSLPMEKVVKEHVITLLFYIFSAIWNYASIVKNEFKKGKTRTDTVFICSLREH